MYDTYVFGLTLHRTFPSIRNKEAGNVVRTLFADGLLYYRYATHALRVALLTNTQHYLRRQSRINNNAC